MEVALYRTSAMTKEKISLQQLRTLIQHAYKKKKQDVGLGTAMKCRFCAKKAL